MISFFMKCYSTLSGYLAFILYANNLTIFGCFIFFNTVISVLICSALYPIHQTIKQNKSNTDRFHSSTINNY